MPAKIANAPSLRLGLQMYLTGWLDLDSSRPAGPELTRIPWTAVNDYCLRLGLDDEQYEDMLYYIQAMDTAYITKHGKG